MTGDESDISSYTSSRPHYPSRPRPTSSDSTGFVGDTCDDGMMEAVGERSRMAVIYEQQLGRRNRRRKRYEARAWEAPQAILRTMEVVLGGLRPSHRAGVGGKLEREKSVKTQALRKWDFLTSCRLIWI